MRLRTGLEVCGQGTLPDVKGFGLPDHIGDRRGTGIAQKHGVLGFMTQGGLYFYGEPGGDVVNDIGAVVFI